MYEEPKTFKESIQFIEAALVASTSRVLQKRKILEEEHFQKADYAGVYVSLLNPSSSIARNVLNKIKSVCSVLEDGYLSKYSIVICDDSSNPENAIEAFTWQFHYYGETVNATFSSDKSTSSVSFPGKKRAKKTMIKLLKEISHIATKLLDPLPDGCFAGMRIAYNDKKPRDYGARGFLRTFSTFILKNEKSRVSNNNIMTKFHGFSFIISSTLFNEETLNSSDDLLGSSMKTIEPFRSYVENPFEDQIIPNKNNANTNTSTIGIIKRESNELLLETSLSNTNNSPSRLEMTSKDESMETIEHFRSFVESPFEDQLNENIAIMDVSPTNKNQCEIQPSYLESSECGTIDLNSQRDFSWDDD